ncbi:unnamed protein product [Linum tenue]|uniref:DOG1 domain-containing protein n=2 Tax=Linum tenue TaxID=586396 RepID=A0AAV0M2W8_9ROSI|nr:unnamed protein product [Linum tenue]
MIDELQRVTIRDERIITEKMAKVQESVADADMVNLSHAVSEMMRRGHVAGDDVAAISERVERALVSKERKMEEMLAAADDLRLMTLTSIVDDILTPIQAVHFLIAVLELRLRVHDWGKRRDEQR